MSFLQSFLFLIGVLGAIFLILGLSHSRERSRYLDHANLIGLILVALSTLSLTSVPFIFVIILFPLAILLGLRYWLKSIPRSAVWFLLALYILSFIVSIFFDEISILITFLLVGGVCIVSLTFSPENTDDQIIDWPSIAGRICILTSCGWTWHQDSQIVISFIWMIYAIGSLIWIFVERQGYPRT